MQQRNILGGYNDVHHESKNVHFLFFSEQLCQTVKDFQSCDNSP